MSIFCQQKRATAINSKVLGPFKGQAAISRMPVLFRSVNRSQEMTSGIVRQALVKAADDLPKQTICQAKGVPLSLFSLKMRFLDDDLRSLMNIRDNQLKLKFTKTTILARKSHEIHEYSAADFT